MIVSILDIPSLVGLTRFYCNLYVLFMHVCVCFRRGESLYLESFVLFAQQTKGYRGCINNCPSFSRVLQNMESKEVKFDCISR